MKKTSLVFLIAIAVLGSGCPHEPSPILPAIVEADGRSEIAFRLPERDLIPEGICYDPEDDVFYLGSIRKSKILKISRDGEVSCDLSGFIEVVLMHFLFVIGKTEGATIINA